MHQGGQVLRDFKGCDDSLGWGRTFVQGQGCCQELIHSPTHRTDCIKHTLNLSSKFPWVLSKVGKSPSLSNHHRHNSYDHLNKCRKAVDKIKQLFPIKKRKQSFGRLGIEGNFLDLREGIRREPRANIFSGEGLNAQPPRSGTRQGCLLSPLLFSIILEVLASSIRQEKEMKGIQIGKEEVKLYLKMSSLSM